MVIFQTFILANLEFPQLKFQFKWFRFILSSIPLILTPIPQNYSSSDCPSGDSVPGRQDGQASQVSRSLSCLHGLGACTQVLAGEHDQRWRFLLCASLECLEGTDKEKETGWEGSCYSMKG